MVRDNNHAVGQKDFGRNLRLYKHKLYSYSRKLRLYGQNLRLNFISRPRQRPIRKEQMPERRTSVLLMLSFIFRLPCRSFTSLRFLSRALRQRANPAPAVS